MSDGRGHLELWGKADPARAERGPAWHPLAFHILDVAAVALHLLELRPARTRAMSDAIGLPSTEAIPWIAFFVALHDLGKATPAFQRIADGHEARLTALGYAFGESREPHGGLSTVLVPPELVALGVDGMLARWVARAVGAHHGDFATDMKVCDLEARRNTSARWLGFAPARAS
ncbi:MAG: CRISPR-associated endonuclease Cas3'' [Polyangiaceae bacterium]